MAVNLVVQYKNKRHNVRAGPMKPLGHVVEELCQKLKLRVEPETCQLLLKGAPVELSTPLRLMNLPPSAKLELVSSGELGQTLLKTPAASTTTGLSSLDKGQTAGRAGTGGGAKSELTTSDARCEGASAGSGGPGLQPPVAQPVREISGEVAEAADRVEGRDGQGPSSAAGGPAELGSANVHEGNAGEWNRNGWSSLASVDRKFCLFRRDALVEASAGGIEAGEDVPDDFYDFTAEDYHRVMKEHQEKVAFQEAGLRTRALREFADHAKAQALGPVDVRLFFPSGEVCQAEFRATDTIGEVYEFGSRLVHGGRGSFVLYTTPPRRDLMDEELTLYKAQLIPAANIHVGGVSKRPMKGKRKVVGEDDVPVLVELKEDVRACLMDKPPTRHTPDPAPCEKEATIESVSEAAAASRPSSQIHAKPKKGVPKWMKL